VLFLFILVNNLIGMVPYSFASTSHYVLTFSLSFTIVLGATILGFSNPLHHQYIIQSFQYMANNRPSRQALKNKKLYCSLHQ
jgi:F0F1-type ATP synthase membrane subunit a